METERAGLAEAVKEIADLATAEPQVHELGTIGNCPAHVVFLRDTQGGLHVRGLTDVLQSTADFAKRQRLEKASGPDRREGTANLQSLESFIAHANRFKSDESAVWADAANRKLVSVLDYHPKGSDAPAAWGKHRGVYPCPLSEAWQAWGGGRALKLSQEEFAALLDARDCELSGGKLASGNAPDPSFLLTLANNLEVFSSATCKRERDPNTGRLKLSYSEEKGVSGTLAPPPAFLIRIPVFVDSEPDQQEVRLRVTVEEGHARFEVQLHAASDVLRTAFDGLCNDVAEGTQLPVFQGTPE